MADFSTIAAKLTCPHEVIGPCLLVNADCLAVLPLLEAGSVDAIVCDPPYSDRTHKGHDATANVHRGFGFDDANRNVLGYAAWSADDVERFVTTASPVCNGWMVCMSDHVMAPHWHDAMSAARRYTFAPLPWYAPGSRVRLSGDGPSSWATWIVVSRTKAQLRWGTLPGGYTQRGQQLHMGGKPVELMEAIVGDYSRQGQTVCDPCMGSGTTGVACIRTGRRFIGIELDAGYYAIACDRIRREWETYQGGPMFAPQAKAPALF
jgi:site-specific DNA-methyltransferase (adenine-specific)